MIRRGVAFVTCLAAAILAFALMLRVTGADAPAVIRTLATGGFSSSYGLVEAVVKAVPILLCALAAAVPGRLGLVNIGGEGQLLVGAIGATWATRLWPGAPPPMAWVLMAASGALLGAVWGWLPGLLRGMTRANETVIGLLLNYVAALILLHMIHGPWIDPASLGWPQTAELPASAILPAFWGTRIHAMVFVGLVLALALTIVAARTSAGMAARVIEANPATASYVGLKVGLYYGLAFAVGGAIAGLAGYGELAGIQGRLRDGMSLGYGYAGFFVAWLCRNRFEWLPLGALLFGVVVTGADSLQVVSGLPFASVYLLQGLFFLAVLAIPAVDRRLRSGLWRSRR